MIAWRFITASTLLSGVVAQTTYTGCHMDGSVSICYDSEGVELAITTMTSSVSSTPASAAATTTVEAQTTAVTACHAHETDLFCLNGEGEEVQVEIPATMTTPYPAQFTDCHAHDTEQFCVDPEGNDVIVHSHSEEGHSEDGHDHGSEESGSSEGLNCHFHAGVEHCVASGESESSSAIAVSCEAPAARDYNIGLRVGSIFIILVTSSIAVFFPLILHKLPFGAINNTIFTIIKQFGTGIIISTAFVHLYTHAYLMFTNQCLTGISYEATTSAVVMAGLFVCFLVEYLGYRFVIHQDKRQGISSAASNSSEEGSHSATDSKSKDAGAHASNALQNISHSHAPADFNPNTVLAVGTMEAGILFHSVLIGLTLVVAPDSSDTISGYYNTLLAVIVFHQFFEGLALGARIALLPTSSLALGMWSKFIMAICFSLITPLGMAIGIGVLNQFNGNDPNTILTIAVLDALSAGVLLWVGVVDMWARDWAVAGGEMVQSGLAKTLIGMTSLIAGLVLMSVLGKWA